MDYKYTELDYAKNIFDNGFQSENHKPTELRLVATYMRRILEFKPQKLREEFYKWTEIHISGYKREVYYKMINRAINQACKKGSTLINIDKIEFYLYEMDFINELFIIDDIDNQTESEYSYECKKLLFTLLFKMKVNKYITEIKSQDSDFEYQGKYFKGGQKRYTELKKLAKLPEKVRINEDIINNLWISGLVSPMYSGLIKMDFMKEIYKIQKNNKDTNNEPVIVVRDFDSVGWYYDYYNSDSKISFCKCCGKIFKKKNNRQNYCSIECSEYINKEKTKERMKSIRNNV